MSAEIIPMRRPKPDLQLPPIPEPLPPQPFVTLSYWPDVWTVMIESGEQGRGLEISAARYRHVGGYPSKAEALRVALAVCERFGGLDLVDRSQPDPPGAA